MKKFFLILVIGCLLNNLGHAASFTCKYSGGSSKIKIAGGTATETTSAGIKFYYTKAERTPKGAYSIERPTEGNRAWFIGAISFLLLGAQMNPAECR